MYPEQQQLQVQKYILQQLIFWFLKELRDIVINQEEDVKEIIQNISNQVLDIFSLIEPSPELALLAIQDF